MSEYLANCTPGYDNGESTATGKDGFLQGHYSEGGIRFYEMLQEWRERGDMAGLTVS